MSVRPKFGSFADMPTGLRKFLFSSAYNDAEQNWKEKFKVTAEAGDTVGEAIMDIVFHEASLEAGLVTIRSALVPAIVSEGNWKICLEDLIKGIFWPIRELFGDELSRFLSEQQISAGGWPPDRVLLKPLTYSGASSELATRVGLSLLGPQMRERMRDIVIGRAKGKLTEAQVKDMLVRQVDFGGMGLDEKMAEKTIKALTDVMESVDLMSEDQYADWLLAQTRVDTPEVQEEHAMVAEVQKVKDAALMPLKTASMLDAAIDETWNALPEKPTDAYLEKRLKNIISTRLRDVRTSPDVLNVLQRESKVGGMDFTREQADAVVAVMDQVYVKTHAQIKEDERQKLEDQLAFQQRKVEARKKQEAEDHAKWYQERIASQQKGADQQKELTEQMRKAFEQSATNAAANPVDAKGLAVEKQRFGDLVPAPAPVGVGNGSSAPLLENETHSRPAARPEVKISQATAVGMGQIVSTKPRLDDVRVVGAPRLAGLADELANLSVSAFRRMGKNPVEAVQKIFQKVDLLGQESFARKLEGAQAWKASPVQRAYMALVSESFKVGKPVAALAEEKRSKGEDTLSPDEVAAIVNLNAKLHFS